LKDSQRYAWVLAEKALLGMISILLDGAFEQALEIATNATDIRAHHFEKTALKSLRFSRWRHTMCGNGREPKRAGCRRGDSEKWIPEMPLSGKAVGRRPTTHAMFASHPIRLSARGAKSPGKP
jgi:hypothetical protein